jgi:hypothetical protein
MRHVRDGQQYSFMFRASRKLSTVCLQLCGFTKLPQYLPVETLKPQAAAAAAANVHWPEAAAAAKVALTLVSKKTRSLTDGQTNVNIIALLYGITVHSALMSRTR